MADYSEQALLAKIGEVRFALVELQLYLDTHPEDLEAQNDFNSYANALEQLCAEYTETYGPLENYGNSPHVAGSWVYQKWPWQN
ncbi:MAG: spore coat protein CotJB [Clostridia bacterium]|nr:spore coat protein CotJB [Clostridia bacterium]